MLDIYGRVLPTYKGAFHTHTTLSDGIFAPAEVLKLYRDADYDIVALTDHRRANAVSTLDGLGMTLISGMEMHPPGPRGILWHIVALNVPEAFDYPTELAAQDMIDLVNKLGGICICAHPHWCGLTSAEVLTLKGLAGLEVFNAATRYIGKEYNMQLWDEMLDAGSMLPAYAVDDMHRPRDLFRGWTVVAAPDPSLTSVMTALKQGDFYATQGPQFHRLHFADGVFSAEFSPCTEVIGLTNFSGGYCAAVPDEEGPGSGTKECSSFSAPLTAKRPGTWFRLQIRDSQGRYAWSNPIAVPSNEA
jgi:hypothetical protein